MGDRTCSGHVCGAGYTSNPAASTIARPATGRDAACCIPKTCASVGCNANRELSGTPTWVFNAATPTNPTESGCCKDKTGYCTGNMASANNVGCGTGYIQKTDFATMAGTTVAECCVAKTCASVGCNANRELSGTPTWTFDANNPTNPTESGCCKDKVGYCTGNMASANNVVCNNGFKNLADFATKAGTTVAECCDQQTCGDVAYTCPWGSNADTTRDNDAIWTDVKDSNSATKNLRCCKQNKCVVAVAHVLRHNMLLTWVLPQQ